MHMDSYSSLELQLAVVCGGGFAFEASGLRSGLSHSSTLPPFGKSKQAAAPWMLKPGRAKMQDVTERERERERGEFFSFYFYLQHMA